MPGKPTKHGGARKGAGAKLKAKPDYDETFKKDIVGVLAKLKKKHGNKSFLEAAFEMMWQEKVQDTVKSSLLKTYAEIFTVKKSEVEANVNQTTGPGILLPEEAQDITEKVG